MINVKFMPQYTFQKALSPNHEQQMWLEVVMFWKQVKKWKLRGKMT